MPPWGVRRERDLLSQDDINLGPQAFELGLARYHIDQLQRTVLGQIRQQGAATASALDQDDHWPVTTDQRFTGRAQRAVGHLITPLIGEDITVGADPPYLDNAVAVANPRASPVSMLMTAGRSKLRHRGANAK